MPLNRSPEDMTSTQVLFDHEIIWKFGEVRIQDYASAYKIVYITWSAILRRLSECYLIHYKDEPGIQRMIAVAGMVEMIGIRIAINP